MMRFFSTLLAACAVASLLPSCGYSLNGVKPPKMEDMSAFSVRMFENNTTEPLAGVLVTNAVADMVQRDGTYKLARSGAADFRIEGTVEAVSFRSLRPNSYDTYVSSEIALELTVRYRIMSQKDNSTLYESTIQAEANFYNEAGNVQTARDNAISYAARKIAEELAFAIST